MKQIQKRISDHMWKQIRRYIGSQIRVQIGPRIGNARYDLIELQDKIDIEILNRIQDEIDHSSFRLVPYEIGDALK